MIIGSVVSGLSVVLSVIPICGWILAIPSALVMLPVGVWLTVFPAHLYGQIGRQAGMTPRVV